MTLPPGSAGALPSSSHEGVSGKNSSILDRGARSTKNLSPIQQQVDGTVSSFVDQATEWKSLAAIMAGGVSYRYGRIAFLDAAQHLAPSLQKVPSLIKGASILFGLSTEVSAFELTHRTLLTVSPSAGGGYPGQQENSVRNLWSFSGPQGLITGWISSFVTFGILKGFGQIAQGQNLILQHGTQDLGMVIGHQMVYRMGLGEKPEGAFVEQLLHAEATNLQLGAGMTLGHLATGGRLLALEKGLDLSLLFHPGEKLPHPFLGEALGFAFGDKTFAPIGPKVSLENKKPTPKVPHPIPSPTILMMGKEDFAEDIYQFPFDRGGSPKPDGEKGILGNKGPQNNDVQVILGMVKERLRNRGAIFSVDAKVLQKIQDIMGQYKKGGEGRKSGSVPRKAFPDIAEEIVTDLIARGRTKVERTNEGNETNGVVEKPLSVREAATTRIDEMIEEALGHKKSPISAKDPAAAKVREVLRSRFLKELERFLAEVPEISNFAELETYGFFSGKKSTIVDYLAEVSRSPDILEKDRAKILAEDSKGSGSSAASAPKIRFESVSLHRLRQQEVKDWLGDRSLDSLTEAEQKDLIRHLTEAKKWNRGDLQTLIGVEGMRQFLGYGKELPFGFETLADWKAFQKKLMTELAAAGVPIHDPRVKVVLQGSAVKGQSHESKNGTPFRWRGNHRSPAKDYRRPSDFDIAIVVDQSLFDTFQSKSLEWIREREGPGKEGRVDLDSKRIQREKRLASGDLNADLQTHLLNLRKQYGQRPIQVSIMGPGCYLIPGPAETMVISADILTGGN